jgi:putative resolvase
MSSLTPQEAADLLGVTVKTLHRWEADQKIKSTRTVGGHRRYDIADLIGNKTGRCSPSRLELGLRLMSKDSQA